LTAIDLSFNLLVGSIPPKLGLLSNLVYLRNVEYSFLVVMSELSTVRCDHVLGL